LSTQTEYTVLLGENVSLTCGYNLTSNPASDTTNIIWQSPDGARIKSDDLEDNNDINVDNGPDVVRLDITGVDKMDNGVWNCTIEEQYTVALEIHLNVVCKLLLYKTLIAKLSNC
jgi:hypothetical protein